MMLESVSFGGVEVTASRPLPVGEPVALEIRVGGQRVPLAGAVLSNRETQGGVRTAIRLDPLDEAHGQKLGALIELALSVREGSR
jgi:hypothetical protein